MRESVGAPIRPADSMLFVGRQLAESGLIAVRLEHRVVAETSVAARGPDHRSEDAAFGKLLMAVRPRDHERGDEMGAAVRRLHGASALKLALDPLHRDLKVFSRSAPPGREQAGRAVEG